MVVVAGLAKVCVGEATSAYVRALVAAWVSISGNQIVEGDVGIVVDTALRRGGGGGGGALLAFF